MDTARIVLRESPQSTFTLWTLRAWNSPTLTTWGGFAARSLSLLLVLPYALRKLSAPEIQVWQLLAAMGTIQMLLDLGLSPTFARVIARSVKQDADEGADAHGETDWERVGAIWRTMHWLYRWPTVGGWLVVAPIGTVALWTAMHQLANPTTGWTAWAIVAVTAPLIFPTLAFSCYLQGLNHIAVLRRWEAITGVGAIVTNFVVLMLGGRLLALVISTQVWLILGLVRNWYLCREVSERKARDFGTAKFERSVWPDVWPPAWRSGLGVLMTSGFVQATGFIYSQFGKPAEVASYLVALRYLTGISQFSTAPFYSKLPRLARLQAQGRIKELLALAQRGMRWSHLSFALGVIAASWILPWFLARKGSDVSFVTPALWWLMTAAFFSERYGAMHLQLYSTTNIIVWHVANGVAGVLMIISLCLLLYRLGDYAFAASMLIGYLGFYSWYSVLHSQREFQIPLVRFETKALLPAVMLMCLVLVAQCLLS